MTRYPHDSQNTGREEKRSILWLRYYNIEIHIMMSFEKVDSNERTLEILATSADPLGLRQHETVRVKDQMRGNRPTASKTIDLKQNR
jgi:hypothetical protein